VSTSSGANIVQNGLVFYSDFAGPSLVSPKVLGGDTVTETVIDGKRYIVHEFTQSGSTNFLLNKKVEADILLVGGGGCGGSSVAFGPGGGGGGGEVFSTQKVVLPAGSHALTVGSGGVASTTSPTSGGNSSFTSSNGLSYTARGGGRGGQNTVGQPGGSGGGGARGFTGGASTAVSPGLGTAGGLSIGTLGAGAGAGGGGGATVAGGNTTAGLGNAGAAGGEGASLAFTGSPVVYGSGGGGGGRAAILGGLGGTNAGSGSTSLASPGGNGVDGTGSGGGGGHGETEVGGILGGNGGSGLVAIRYEITEKYSKNVNTREVYNPVSPEIVGTFLGNPTFSLENNGIFSFSTDRGIVYPDDLDLNSQSFSVSVWIKTNSTNQNGFWFEKGTVNTQYSLFQSGTNILFRVKPVGTTTNTLSVSATTHLNTTNWFNVVGTYTPGTRRIFVNGNIIASDTYNAAIDTSPGGMSIGVHGGFSGSRGFWYNGNIGSVSVYNRDLSQGEVRQNFNALRGRYGI